MNYLKTKFLKLTLLSVLMLGAIPLLKAQTLDADFTFTPKSPCLHSEVQFHDSSSGNPDSFNWYFEGGGYSTNSDPSHFFNDSNQYVFKVTLVVMKNTNSGIIKDSITKDVRFDTTCSNKNVISGNVYYDQNGNGVRDNGEEGIEHAYINIPEIPLYLSTDKNGHYAASVGKGTFTIKHYIQIKASSHTQPQNPDHYSVSFSSTGNSKGGLNFGIQPDSAISDLAISNFFNSTRLCFESKQYIWIHNNGNIIEKGTIKFYNDPKVVYKYASDSNFNYDYSKSTGTLSFNGLKPGRSLFFTVMDSIPCDTSLVGESGCWESEVTSQTNPTDINSENNHYKRCLPFGNSWDPNDKLVDPQDTIDRGDTLDYKVRFQNTGNAKAYRVIIFDTLESNIDKSYFEVLGASHDYTYQIKNDSIVKFVFNDINLVDSSVSQEESQGFVSFQVKAKDNLPYGTTVNNNAGIVFDYNPPVITNTTTNTIYKDYEFCEGLPTKNSFYRVLNGQFSNIPFQHRKEGDFIEKDDKNGLVFTGAFEKDGLPRISLTKVNESGQLKWFKYYPFEAYSTAHSVKRTNDSGFIISGTTETDDETSNNIFLLKTDNKGNLEWRKTYSNTYAEKTTNVEQNRMGEYVVTSYHDPWSGIKQSGDDLVIMKAGSDGNLQYYKTYYNSDRHYEYYRDMTFLDDGFITVGGSGHKGDFVGGLVTRFDSDGNIIWKSQYRGPTPSGSYDLRGPEERSWVRFKAIKQMRNGNFLITGNFSNEDENADNATFKRGIILELEPNGSVVWSNQYQFASSENFTRFNNLSMFEEGFYICGSHGENTSEERSFVTHFENNGFSSYTKTLGEQLYHRANLVKGMYDDRFWVKGFLAESGDYSKPYFAKYSPDHPNCFRDTSLVRDELPLERLPISLDQNSGANVSNQSVLTEIACVDRLDLCEEDGNNDDTARNKKQGLSSIETLDNGSENKNIEIYPNPVESILKIRVKEVNLSYQVNIQTVTGQTVKRAEFNKKAQSINLGELEKGAYIVRVLPEQGKPFTERIIKR